MSAHECLGCCESFPCSELVTAGDSTVKHDTGRSTSSSVGEGCGHRFCRPCLRTYVTGVLRVRTYPVPCPMGALACGHVFDHDTLAELLGQGSPQLRQELERLEAEASIAPGLLTFCPHKDCSEPVLRTEDGEPLPPDQPATCPACHRAFCPHCAVPGWHEGYTCAQFQALPPHQRTAEDAAVLQLSASQRWKPCPGCRHVVERSEGCNHMHCRCGTHFCYKCGAAYTKAADGRSRGDPTCTCALFDVPGEGEAAAGEAADHARAAPLPVAAPAGAAEGVVAMGAAHRRVRSLLEAFIADLNVELERALPVSRGRRGLAALGGGGSGGGGRPWRNGRQVSSTRCRHSASIHDCPHGPGRCWFWHDEDGPAPPPYRVRRVYDNYDIDYDSYGCYDSSGEVELKSVGGSSDNYDHYDDD